MTRRLDFWSVLATEQERDLTVSLDADDEMVGLAEESVESLVDTLVGNVFAHTPAGTAFEVASGVDDQGRCWLRVSDRGPGFPDDLVLERGVSPAGSTGLGLDIARRTAELTAGELQINDRPGGGAVVVAVFGSH